MIVSKSLKAVTVSAVSLLFTGCMLSPGAELNPKSDAKGYELVDINQTMVNQEPVQRTEYDEIQAQSDRPYQYHIGPHDILSIRVWNNPDLSTSQQAMSSPFSARTSTIRDSNELIRERQQVTPEGVEVQANGLIFFPFAGEVRAAGRTVSEIRNELTQKLSKYVRDPQVSVRVQSFNSQKAQIIGEVAFPRPLPITSTPLRILDAIALAEGLKDSADKSEAVLIRGNRRQIVDMARLLDGDMNQNYLMLDGDVLNIDSNRFRQISILGEVNKPIAMPYDRRGMSLNDALVSTRCTPTPKVFTSCVIKPPVVNQRSTD
ncbi:polysaccharide biosynthesis/export family protein [Endozoicomonas acroporae]|uniref:polysaccharide biosynthesis/export family protein n=1 Tax=Endozoicomonas acroporae TaxID=1701104 RepID=UPI003D7A158D